MKEARRRELAVATRKLHLKEVALDKARSEFAATVKAAVEIDGESLGSVSKTLSQLGRPISRQRVHQIAKGN